MRTRCGTGAARHGMKRGEVSSLPHHQAGMNRRTAWLNRHRIGNALAARASEFKTDQRVSHRYLINTDLPALIPPAGLFLNSGTSTLSSGEVPARPHNAFVLSRSSVPGSPGRAMARTGRTTRAGSTDVDFDIMPGPNFGQQVTILKGQARGLTTTRRTA